MARPNFGSLFSNSIVLGVLILEGIAWLVAFVGQAVVEATYDGLASAAGTLWFAIFLQLGLLAGTVYAFSSGTLAIHRPTLSLFTAVALVFSVQGVNAGIYGYLVKPSASRALGVGYLLLSFVNIFWLLLLTADEESALFQYVIYKQGGQAFMSKRSRTTNLVRRSSSAQGMTAAGISSESYYANGFATKEHGTAPSIVSSIPNDSYQRVSHSLRTDTPPPPRTMSPATPGGLSHVNEEPTSASLSVKQAKALYAYQANPEDPNELSFAKGEVLDILDDNGKWFRARARGQEGIVPSNYLRML